MQATNLFRDTLTSRIEPVYGLTTLHATLRAFRDAPLTPSATTEIRDSTYAFGLIALGKFFLRLPPEVLEEELPRLRSTLISVSYVPTFDCRRQLIVVNRRRRHPVLPSSVPSSCAGLDRKLRYECTGCARGRHRGDYRCTDGPSR